MNRFKEFYSEYEDNHADKFDNYLDIYDDHFKRFKSKKNLVLMEIGVFKGDSLKMWKYYFGEKVTIYGVDINPECKKYEDENIHIIIGSQSDQKFLNKLKELVPKIDILIDDGGHTMRQQIKTFKILFDHISEEGVYLCEDLHTSYWLSYGGGHKRTGTFIEFSKNFIDKINARYSQQRSLKVDAFTRSVKSLHYYDSVLVIEKGHNISPKRIVDVVSNLGSSPKIIKRNFLTRLLSVLLRMFNRILCFFHLPSFYYGR
ncbi:MAG: class I SAM-dependent methyltransferase [Candidatus Margulisbacteria bacterium]|nr:class I SAM-dependent methyltransferase [Candidatus Margulisiibacteriota bacterium]